jgi:hypothetical protein
MNGSWANCGRLWSILPTAVTLLAAKTLPIFGIAACLPRDSKRPDLAVVPFR